MIKSVVNVVLVVAALVTLSTPALAQWGDLTGKFVYDGKAPAPTKIDVTKDVEVCGKFPLVDESLLVGEDGGLANIVVYVRSRNVKVHPDYDALKDEKAILDNNGCRFQPHVLPVWIEQTMELHNSDPVPHNSNIAPLGDKAVNPLLPPMGMLDHTFRRKQTYPVPVSCNIHPWMKGYVLPAENPYVAVTAEDGSFTLKNLPAGKELEFHAWHEKSGNVDPTGAGVPKGWSKGRFKLKIAEGANDLGTIKLAPKLFEK
ncbi:MAG: hypothetical protein R3C10_23010 [Pirellulales bacterium]|nr:hypothetical protein [Planctomycetales bacterium]